jgi:hypothetical protein
VGQRGHSKSRDYNYFYGRGNKDHLLARGFFVHQRIAPTVKRVEFVSNRVSYIVMRGRWNNIVFLNVHTPIEKNDESKDSFYEELELVFFIISLSTI